MIFAKFPFDIIIRNIIFQSLLLPSESSRVVRLIARTDSVDEYRLRDSRDYAIVGEFANSNDLVAAIGE